MWKLYKFENGEKIFIADFESPDGRDCMGDEMYEWMEGNGYYGDASPDDYNYDGDSESVAIMGKKEGMTDFCFEWVE
jgi:hypothetical protein